MSSRMLYKVRSIIPHVQRRCFCTESVVTRGDKGSKPLQDPSEILRKHSDEKLGDRIFGVDPGSGRKPELFYPEGNISLHQGAIDSPIKLEQPNNPFDNDFNLQDLTTLEGFSYQTQTATFKTALNLGLHWGHSIKKTHHSMQPYIKGSVHGRQVIDLSLTLPMLRKTVRLMQSLVQDKCNILFVGNGLNDDIKRLNQLMALKVGMPWLEYRFPKNAFKSWNTMALNYRSSGKLFPVVPEDDLSNDSELARSYQASVLFRRCRAVPDFVFLTTRKYNNVLIRECNFSRIPVAALCDTDDDARDLQYIIPCNSDSPQAVHFVLDIVTRGILEAQEKMESEWWAQKQDAKEYVQALKDAQDTYNTDLFIEKRSKDLRRRDINYDSERDLDDNEPDYFEQFNMDPEVIREKKLMTQTTERFAKFKPFQPANPTGGGRHKGDAVSEDPAKREAEYLRRVRRVNYHGEQQKRQKEIQDELDGKDPSTRAKAKKLRDNETQSFSFTHLITESQAAIAKSRKAKPERQPNTYTTGIY